MMIQFHKRDVLLWRSWGIFPSWAYQDGLDMLLPSGRVVRFVPCKNTSTPALKPIESPGYKEWVRMMDKTEIIVSVYRIREEVKVS